MLIAFSGLDGSGKGTQIQGLRESLASMGKKPVCLWARGGYTPGFEWLKRIMRGTLGPRVPPPGPSDARKKRLNNPHVARVWLRLAIVDLLLFWGVRVRVQRLTGHVVICDRYIDDTRLDFRRNFPSVPFEKMVLWRMLEGVTPRPDVAFLLWIPVEESMRRSNEKGEPFPDDEETLTWRLKAYMDEAVFPMDRYIRLDCRRSVAEVSQEIIGTIGRLFAAGGRADAG